MLISEMRREDTSSTLNKQLLVEGQWRITVGKLLLAQLGTIG